MLNRSHSKILIMTAVDAEQQAVLRGLDGYEGADVQLAGVGPASAAASTATALARAGQTADGPYSLVLSAGIGGGFAEVA
ncbi:futalosine hydrolase, partial [Paenibacillus barengoltzii]